MDGIYSDFQLLRYAETRGFPRDEERCLLRDVSGGAPDGVISEPQRRLADYVCAAMTAPGRSLRVFARGDWGFLRFRAAQPRGAAADAAYGVLYETGPGGAALGCENPDMLLQMLGELWPPASAAGTAGAFSQLSALALLCLLAACDVLGQKRFGPERFTALSVFNALHTAGDADPGRLLAPLADVTGDFVCAECGPEDAAQVLDALAADGLLLTEEAEGAAFYRFAPALAPVRDFFARCGACLACELSSPDEHTFLCAFSDGGCALTLTLEDGGAALDGAPRAGLARLERLLPPRARIGGGQWTCACGAVSGGSFCPACGREKPAPRFCTACGSPLRRGASFCTNCGERTAR